MVTGRKYTGMAAMFGERVLARLSTTNGEDRFRPGIWLGKTDRADFHIVATVDGLRWTRTIRRLPIAYDAERPLQMPALGHGTSKINATVGKSSRCPTTT